MWNYIQAENLKCRRTFAKALILLAPALVLFHAALTSVWFIANGYNWWYVMILPGFLSLVPALMNQYEDKRLRYRAVFSLPVSLMKTWLAKIALIGIYLVSAGIFHFAVLALGKATIYARYAASYSYGQMLAASLVLIVTTLWQIPFCLFLAKKFGTMVTILVNVLGGIALNVLAATEDFWWLCPYSWGARLMCPVIHVMPNGLLAKQGNTLLNTSVIPAGIILSITLFVALSLVTAEWFQKQEVR